MTVKELIDRLKQLDPNLLVVEARWAGEHYVGYEEWYPSLVDVVHAAGVLAHRDMWFEYDDTDPEHKDREKFEAVVMGGS